MTYQRITAGNGRRSGVRYLQIVILSLAFSTLSVAENLPELGEASTVSGTPTTAQFFGGVTSDGGASYLSTVNPDKPIDIVGSWQPEVAHVNTVGNFYVVVQLDESYYFQNEEGQFQEWDLDLKTLQAARQEITLASVEQIVIIKDFALGLAGLSGKTLFVFLAYETASVPGELFYSGTPIAISVNSSVSEPSPAQPLNLSPSASISGGNQSVADSDGVSGEPVSLSGGASDSDGSVLSTQWLVDGSVVATGTSATLSLPDGSTVVTFRVTDNEGATTDATVTITVAAPAAPNLSPSASISGGNQSVADSDGVSGEPVSLSGGASDSDGSVLSTQWLVDGSVVATGTSATLSLPDGSTVVTFRVTDNDGATTDATATITVEAVNSVPNSMQIYTESISSQIVQARCVNCHGGIAALTLVRSNVDDYINKNYNSMKDYIKQGGSNRLLSKPQGINHGGGVQLQSGSTDLNNLESFIDAIVSE